jgi:gamma-glutamylcysteine synthetase
MEIHMKRSLAIAVGTVALLAAGMPLAQDAKAPASNLKPTAVQSGSSMNMSNQMDEHMQKMKALHEKMTSAATPEERQKVMDEQRQEMQAGMGMMNQMMQGGGMKGNMGGGMMGQKGKPADATSQMQMMQKRMDMMQMMMQTMMDQQGMMTGPRSLDAAPKK